jgi:hypothetical protein
MDEAGLIAAARKTWPMHDRQPRFVVAVQVHNGAGFSYGRRLDLVVFDTWPSKGLYLHGIEIKCTKSDLRRELQDTAKFAEFSAYLDKFSIAAPPDIVDLKLLPPKWGLYCPTPEGTLRARRKPLMLHQEGKRDTLDRSVAAAFVRALVDRSLSDEALRAERQRGYENGARGASGEIERLSREAAAQKTMLETFEANSGIAISTWSAGRIGEAVKIVLDGGIEMRIRYGRSVRDVGTRLLALADELDELSRKFSLERTV